MQSILKKLLVLSSSSLEGLATTCRDSDALDNVHLPPSLEPNNSIRFFSRVVEPTSSLANIVIIVVIDLYS